MRWSSQRNAASTPRARPWSRRSSPRLQNCGLGARYHPVIATLIGRKRPGLAGRQHRLGAGRRSVAVEPLRRRDGVGHEVADRPLVAERLQRRVPGLRRAVQA